MFEAMRLSPAEYQLEDAMIYHAARKGSLAYFEECWKLFKMEYTCDPTSAELFGKFWNEIMVNLDTYQIVNDCSELREWLTCIPNPAGLHMRQVKNYDGVTLINKNLFEAVREDAERRDDFALNGPEGQKFKAMCLAAMAKVKQSQPYRDIHGTQGDIGHSVPIETSSLLPTVERSLETSGARNASGESSRSESRSPQSARDENSRGSDNE